MARPWPKNLTALSAAGVPALQSIAVSHMHLQTLSSRIEQSLVPEPSLFAGPARAGGASSGVGPISIRMFGQTKRWREAGMSGSRAPSSSGSSFFKAYALWTIESSLSQHRLHLSQLPTLHLHMAKRLGRSRWRTKPCPTPASSTDLATPWPPGRERVSPSTHAREPVASFESRRRRRRPGSWDDSPCWPKS